MSRPWTESAERPASSSHDDMHRYIAKTRQQRKARQALDALAPELAEAVLSLDKLTCPTHTRLFGGESFQTYAAHCLECGAILKVQQLALKLREIGANNE